MSVENSNISYSNNLQNMMGKTVINTVYPIQSQLLNSKVIVESMHIKQEKSPPSSRRKNRSTTPNFSKSRLNSGSGRTKDKTNRTINKQKNIIINIKQNFQTCKTPIVSHIISIFDTIFIIR